MSTSMVRGVLAASVIGLAFVLAACGSSGSGSASPVAPASAAPSAPAPTTGASAAPSDAGAGGGGSAVAIKNFSFGPGTLSVPVGTTVTWTNQDNAGHTVTADDASFDSKTLASGTTFTQTFSTAGTFAYHCSIHPAMTGTIEVK